jgi:hypothetical protein
LKGCQLAGNINSSGGSSSQKLISKKLKINQSSSESGIRKINLMRSNSNEKKGTNGKNGEGNWSAYNSNSSGGRN